ncbi:inovirus-type Gp2 protein [Pseudomonas corrugata]|uniref:Inovirus-type Gp2 protein n=1 Tax=Pseudomonas corrugata TaxID=47879 RepID=A0A7Y6DHH3_9PSED|nr:inovirus-type Gp2 protein [Pseudomonas corrugata]NUT87567.1 inovirus-type Gp2 protein [Pseudomonas corrugata]
MRPSKKLKDKTKITYKPDYEGLSINTGKFNNLGVYTTMLKPMSGQIKALLTYHSRIALLMFELHLPVTELMPASSSNLDVTKFFKQIKEDLSSSVWGNQKHVIHFWAIENGTSKNGHYHCMIGFSSTVRVGTFYTAPSTFAWELLERRWNEISGGSLNGSKCHIVNRSNQKEFSDAFEHLSYICKTRDKVFGTGEHHKRYSASRLKHNKGTIQLSITDHQPESVKDCVAA